MATRRSAKAPKLDDLAGQPDAKAPLDWQMFLRAAQPVLKKLQDDLRARAKASPAVAAALQARHAAEKDAKRTGDSFVEWQDHFIEQVAAAWLLSCVFVRTLEDRGLLGHNRIAGPGAADSLKLFMELAPSLNERDYLLTTFRELTRFPATKELFDARHNPVWLLTPSAEGAKALVQLFQQPRADVPAFRFGQSDTGFLGWIYQDLDAGVRERFALLQTPRFVESFILDRTLEPAIEKFGLDDTTLIDPTCGSGHFLLGAFERLFEHRLRKEPGLTTREAAKKALDAVYGADINPYAVGIARFRLTLAFLDRAGFKALSGAPTLPLHVVVADSLLHNPHVSQPDLADFATSSKGWRGEEFALEDEAAARDVLHRNYAAVVGNPPYITVKDPVLRELYRALYPSSAAGKYSVAAPFTERFFQLGKKGARIGMITANSFMKREFGKKLIEQYLPTVNLDLVVNTSGAYIPGHGTPTVLLFGSQEAPTGTTIATVLASRGEPSTPEDPEQGLVWRSIADHWSEAGFENEFISVASTERASLAKHPWSLGGGGAAELKELLEERAVARVSDVVESIGVGGMSNADDVFLVPKGTWNRFGMLDAQVRALVIGEDVRDWSHNDSLDVYFPYDERLDLIEPQGRVLQLLWPYRSTLWARAVFGGGTYRSSGRPWWEWHQVTKERYRTPLTITFAFVATHNHFVLDRGGKVFKQSAPIIKLPDTATEDDHLALLAYLNSSTACFWMKQVFFPKGGSGIGRGIQDEEWESRFEFDGTKLAAIPMPPSSDRLRELARALVSNAMARADLAPSHFLSAWLADANAREPPLAQRRERLDMLLATAVALQEQLDWQLYADFGLLVSKDPLKLPSVIPPGLRAFEHALVVDKPDTAWFARNGYAHPAASTSTLVATQIAALRNNKEVGFLEQPEFKRRWRVPDHRAEESSAALALLADAAERDFGLVVGTTRRIEETTRSRLGRKFDVLIDLAQLPMRELLCAEAVPFLAAFRFTASGFERYAEWERTWGLQRRCQRQRDSEEF
jgi:hypothetical protein